MLHQPDLCCSLADHGGGEKPDFPITTPAAIDGMAFRPRSVIGRAAHRFAPVDLDFVFYAGDFACLIVAV
jgi:hypothetical protein